MESFVYFARVFFVFLFVVLGGEVGVREVDVLLCGVRRVGVDDIAIVGS